MSLKAAIMPLRWLRSTTVGVGLLWTYFLFVLFYGDTILGVDVRLTYLPLITVASFGGLYWLIRWVSARRQLVSVMWLKALTVASITVLLSLVVADVSYSVYFNATHPSEEKIASVRFIDRNTWLGEHSPRRYYPTEKAFLIHKPNMTMESNTYGGFYYRGLMESPTVANSVPELRHVSYVIDEHGFRETTPLEQAHLFALGDSFTFGVGVSQEKTWVKLLEQAIGEPSYNLGVSTHSPKGELMLLEYLLATKPAMKIRHLLWMIFEGNDLEESYEAFLPVQRPKQATFTDFFEGTIVKTLSSIPRTVKDESVIHRLRTGQITFALPFQGTDRTDPYLVDNIKLMYPLYRSPSYGYCLFALDHIERARQPESYVLNHPNRRLLDQTFADMVSLSRKHRFKVTVVIAPSGPRLYAPYFERFPRLSEDSYFINYVEKLSRGLGFDVVNLYRLMQPYAREALLYWRDDSHWNEDGHKVVAEIIAKHVASSTPKGEPPSALLRSRAGLTSPQRRGGPRH